MKDFKVQPNITVRQAMKMLSKSGEKCLVIVDKKNILLGTLSDGDIRKAILNGSNMSDPIQNVYQSSPTVLIDGEYEIDQAKKLFAKNRFDIIPVVDDIGELIDILFWGDILNNGEKIQKEKMVSKSTR